MGSEMCIRDRCWVCLGDLDGAASALRIDADQLLIDADNFSIDSNGRLRVNTVFANNLRSWTRLVSLSGNGLKSALATRVTTYDSMAVLFRTTNGLYFLTLYRLSDIPRNSPGSYIYHATADREGAASRIYLAGNHVTLNTPVANADHGHRLKEVWGVDRPS